MNDGNLYPFAKLADHAYTAPLVTADTIAGNVPGYTLLQQRGGLPILGGYNGLSAYNKATNTLVIASAGSDDLGDIVSNFQYIRGFIPGQVENAVDLWRQSIAELKSQGFENPQVVFVGHSLGGIDSNYAMRSIEGEAKVFAINSPGMYGPIAGWIGGALGFEDRDPNVTYVYSQFYFWTAPVHDSGLPRKERVIIVPGSSGHRLEDIIPYIKNMQNPCYITLDQHMTIRLLEQSEDYRQYSLTSVNRFSSTDDSPVFYFKRASNGDEIAVRAFKNEDGTVQYEVERLDRNGDLVGTDVIIGRQEQSGGVYRFVPVTKEFYDAKDKLIATKDVATGEYTATECFPAGTPILLADGSEKPIEDIRPGDKVLAFDGAANLGRGALQPREVVRLFGGVTQDWIRIDFPESVGLAALTLTPNHRVLTKLGTFIEAEKLIEPDGSVELVMKDGSVMRGQATRIAYSADTAALYQQAAKFSFYYGFTFKKIKNLSKPVLFTITYIFFYYFMNSVHAATPKDIGKIVDEVADYFCSPIKFTDLLMSEKSENNKIYRVYSGKGISIESESEENELVLNVVIKQNSKYFDSRIVRKILSISRKDLKSCNNKDCFFEEKNGNISISADVPTINVYYRNKIAYEIEISCSHESYLPLNKNRIK